MEIFFYYNQNTFSTPEKAYKAIKEEKWTIYRKSDVVHGKQNWQIKKSMGVAQRVWLFIQLLFLYPITLGNKIFSSDVLTQKKKDFFAGKFIRTIVVHTKNVPINTSTIANHSKERNRHKDIHWMDLRQNQLEKLVDSIRGKYEKQKEEQGAETFVIKIRTNKRFEIIGGKNDSEAKRLQECKENGCPLCTSENISIPIHIGERKKHNFHLIQSRRNGVLVFDKKEITFDWTKMKKDSQVKMIQAAQKVANVFFQVMADTCNKNRKKVYLQLHCSENRIPQTVRHTHIHIHGLSIHGNPSSKEWEQFSEVVKQKNLLANAS